MAAPDDISSLPAPVFTDPTGEETQKDKEEDIPGRPPAPVSPAPPPPSAGVGGSTLASPPPPEEDKDPGTRVPRIDDYTKQTFSEIGVTLPSDVEGDLGPTYKVPYTLVEKEYLSKSLPASIPFAEGGGFGGQMAIDMAKVRDDLLKARMKNWAIQYRKNKGEGPSEEEFNERFSTEAQRANDQLYEAAQRTKGQRPAMLGNTPNRLVWVDKDVGGKLYGSIATPFGDLQLPRPGEEAGTFTRLVAPLAMMGAGVEQQIVAEELDEEGKPTGGYILPEYNENHALGYLDYFGRISVLTPLVTAAVAGGADSPLDFLKSGIIPTPGLPIDTQNPIIKGWGSDKQLQLLRSGEDVFSLSDELSAGQALAVLHPGLATMYFADDLGLPVPEPLGIKPKDMIDGIAGFGLAVIDPDAFSAATGGLGKLAKVKILAKVADKLGTSAVAKFTKGADETQKAAEELTKVFLGGTPTLGNAKKAIKEALSGLAPQRRNQVVHTTMQALGMDPKLSGVSEEVVEALARSGTEDLVGKAPVGAYAVASTKRAPRGREAAAKKMAPIAKGTSTQLAQVSKVADALDKAGDVPKAKTLRFQAARYRDAQLKDLSLVTQMADLFAHKKAFSALKGIVRVSGKKPAINQAKMQKRLQNSINQMDEARKLMTEALKEAPTQKKGAYTDKYLKAEKAFEKANNDFFLLGSELTDASTKAAEKILDSLIAQTAKALKNSEKEMSKWGTRINDLNIKGLKISPEAHATTRKAILESAPRQMEPMLIVGAMSATLREMSDQYTNLAKFARAERPGGWISPTKKAIKAYKTLEDAPAGTQKLFGGKNQDIIDVAEAYAAGKGLNLSITPILKLDGKNSKKIADLFDRAKHIPNDPKVRQAYQALASETLEQFDALLAAGYRVELSNQPYKNSEAVLQDLRDNKSLRVFPTDEGFGPDKAVKDKDNPLLAQTNYKDVNGNRLLVNDAFRFVHDVFGHGKLGNPFGPLGEENAWVVHSQMYSPVARRALTTETRGQNSWVNFGPHLRRADGSVPKRTDPDYIPQTQRPYAEQKSFLLPDEYVFQKPKHPGVDIDESTDVISRADEIYLAEQVELLSGYIQTGLEKTAVLRHIPKITKAIKSFVDPATTVLGPMSDEMKHIGITALTYERMGHKDMVHNVNKLAKTQSKKAKKDALQKGANEKQAEAIGNQASANVFNTYIDSPDTVNGSIVNTLFDGRTLWQMAQPIIRSAMNASEGDPEKVFFDTLWKMWLPQGYRGSKKDAGEFINKAQALLRFGGYGAKELKLLKKTDTSDKIKSLSDKEFLEYQAYATRGRSIAWMDNPDTQKKGFFTLMREITEEIAGEVDQDYSRIAARMALVINNAAILNKSATKLTQEIAGWTPEMAEKGAKLMSGESDRMASDYAEIASFLNKIKMPAAIRKLKDDVDKQIEGGLKVYQNIDADNVVLPRQWVKKSTDSIKSLEKELQRFNAAVPTNIGRKTLDVLSGFYRLWQTSLLTGLFVPRPAYWANIYFGNMSQLLGEGEYAAAAKFSLVPIRDTAWAAKELARKSVWASQTLAGKTPLGPYVDNMLDYMGNRLGTDFPLASAFNAVINNDIQKIMDPAYASADEVIAGTGFTIGQMRKWAVDERIYSSFAGTSRLADILQRSVESRRARLGEDAKMLQRGMDKAKAGVRLFAVPKRAYADFADTLEQRQRVALFSDLIVNRGLDPKEAGRIVREALYDWDYPLHAVEINFLRNAFMFWSFQKKAMGQAFRLLTDGFVKGQDDTWADVVVKSAPGLAALSGQRAYKTSYLMALEDFLYHGSRSMVQAGQVQPDGTVEGGTSPVYPSWNDKAASRFFFPNMPMGAERSASYKQSTGRDVTHSVWTMPSFTPIQMASDWLDLTDGMARLGLWLGSLPSSVVLGTETAGGPRDAWDAVLKQLSNIGNPASETIFKELREKWGTEQARSTYLKTGVKVTRRSDRAVLKAFDAATEGWFGEESGLIWKNELAEGEEWRTNESTLDLYRAIPGVANDLNNFIGPALEVSSEGGGVSEAIFETVLSLMNIKKYRYSVDNVRKYDLQDVEESMNRLRKIEQQKGGFEKER